MKFLARVTELVSCSEDLSLVCGPPDIGGLQTFKAAPSPPQGRLFPSLLRPPCISEYRLCTQAASRGDEKQTHSQKVQSRSQLVSLPPRSRQSCIEAQGKVG